ncbi:hypothetical protein [Pedobacter roseus]|uniref:Uncharacterized protein n=1 Tax=Pedobacter roseus TaxID=336820 RepID=A0A7G9QHX6_9SPHI|nr:hypothetical protein [Pedobacter roseus]QNN42951.1 hypothetical protein H9L23_02260 [Pedobacter roseus]
MQDEIFLGLNKDQLLAAIAIVLTIIGAIWYLITLLNKRKLTGSKLTIQLKQLNFWSAPKHLVQPEFDDEGFVIRDLSIVRHYITYRLDLIITNNSEYTAYFPKLYFKDSINPFVELQSLDEHEPILSGASKTLTAVLAENSDTLPTERKRGNEEPIAMKDLQILIECQNSYGAKFYSMFVGATKKNTFHKFKPKFK